MSNRIIYNQKQKAPSPKAPRECDCGCGFIFQPNRSDQRFLDKSHADYYNYHNVKKVKNEMRNEIEKIHRLNNRICHKYFISNTTNNIFAIANYDSLKSEGFDLKYNHGVIVIDNEEHGVTYNYLFHIFQDNGIQKIKLIKNA